MSPGSVYRNKVVASLEHFHQHPDYLETGKFEEYMLFDAIALSLERVQS